MVGSTAVSSQGGSQPLPLESELRAALDTVYDPHMNVSLPDMGMIRRLDITDKGIVEVGVVFPCVGCPAWDLIQSEIKQALGKITGVRRVKVKVEWQHEWNRNDITPDARIIAKEHGYII